MGLTRGFDFKYIEESDQLLGRDIVVLKIIFRFPSPMTGGMGLLQLIEISNEEAIVISILLQFLCRLKKPPTHLLVS